MNHRLGAGAGEGGNANGPSHHLPANLEDEGSRFLLLSRDAV